MNPGCHTFNGFLFPVSELCIFVTSHAAYICTATDKSSRRRRLLNGIIILLFVPAVLFFWGGVVEEGNHVRQDCGISLCVFYLSIYFLYTPTHKAVTVQRSPRQCVSEHMRGGSTRATSVWWRRKEEVMVMVMEVLVFTAQSWEVCRDSGLSVSDFEGLVRCYCRRWLRASPSQRSTLKGRSTCSFWRWCICMFVCRGAAGTCGALSKQGTVRPVFVVLSFRTKRSVRH